MGCGTRVADQSNYALARWQVTAKYWLVSSQRSRAHRTLKLPSLFCAHLVLGKKGALRILDKTYKTTGGFINDLLQSHEEAFHTQPKAVNDEEDCYLQILHMILLQRWKPQHVDFDAERLFGLQLTDFHANKIFVI